MSRVKFAKYDPYATMYEDLEKCMELYEEAYLDPAFQRKGGLEHNSGWNLTGSQSFLTNHIAGETGNFILLVDCFEALKYAKEQEDQESIDYYESVLARQILRALDDKQHSLENAKYLIVDGNNTASTIYWYAKDRFKARVFGSKKLRLYSELKEKEQRDYLRQHYCEVIILRRISRPQVSALFYHLNQSTQLNNQEGRQCQWGDLSDFCRDTPNSYLDVFKTGPTGSVKAIDKRAHEEWFASVALYEDFEGLTNMKKKALDKWYEGQTFNKKGTAKRCKLILQEMNKMLKPTPYSRGFSKGKLHVVWRFVSMLLDDGYQIVDHEAMGKLIYEHIAKNSVSFSKRSFTEKEKPFLNWNHWVKFWNREAEANRLDAYYLNYIGVNEAKWVTKGLIKRIRSSKNSFTFKQKLEAYVLQRGKDRFGKKLEIYDLLNGNLHADHVTPVSQGGETSLPNLEITTSEYNLKKGATTAEPHFPHQLVDIVPGVEYNKNS